MGQVRPFVEEDIPAVTELHRRVFRTGAETSAALRRSYRWYFQEIFLNNPWYDKSMPPLVYEDGDGQVIGFLGVLPRRMTMDGRLIRAAVSSQFVVEPSRRSTLAGVKLLKTFLSGSQDLSLSDEATHASRKLYERLGGTTTLLYSLHWARVLRPGRFFVSRWGKRRWLAPLGLVALPLCRIIDGIAVRLPGSPCSQARPAASGHALDAKTWHACLTEFGADRSLRPLYDVHSLAWLLEILSRKHSCGTLQPVVVRNDARKIVGWYLYYLNPGGIGEVIQIGARQGWIKAVLDHLFSHAWCHGGAALSGHLDPRFIQAFSEKGCFFHHRGHWTLVHAKEPCILQAIHRGDALITRLEGEWCMRFEKGNASMSRRWDLVRPSERISEPTGRMPGLEPLEPEGRSGTPSPPDRKETN